ncbi:hypothetical protein AOXY_G2386 [Acipenser oxyrinchus oxyrinchus]|uniref:DUF4806 domain-containing protein n=1 Tax=Acipenser oxyrinchus oxyrinchus TaxID=40147 RepID=A0AAD8GIH5_ACIOX|nr:hypothetical protein AOXY_G2386 [Acipenser oxyrinchus oxyrinchus]
MHICSFDFISDFQTLIIKLLTEVKSSVADLKAQVNLNTQLFQSMHSGQPDDYTLPEDVVLPVGTKDQLDALEEQLTHDLGLQGHLVSNTAYITVNKFQKVGGQQNIMRHLLTNKLAQGLNWTGHGEKIYFRDLQIRVKLQKAVRRNPATKKDTDEEIQREISHFLRGVGNREGGRKERQLIMAAKAV